MQYSLSSWLLFFMTTHEHSCYSVCDNSLFFTFSFCSLNKTWIEKPSRLSQVNGFGSVWSNRRKLMKISTRWHDSLTGLQIWRKSENWFSQWFPLTSKYENQIWLSQLVTNCSNSLNSRYRNQIWWHDSLTGLHSWRKSENWFSQWFPLTSKYENQIWFSQQ